MHADGQTRRAVGRRCTDLDGIHLFLVVNVLDRQAALTDVKVHARVVLDKKLVCIYTATVLTSSLLH